MKVRGGYLPKIAGRPSHVIRDEPAPGQLFIALRQDAISYSPAVAHGDSVAFGAPLAWAEVRGGRIALPAPANGTVSIGASPGTAETIVLQVKNTEIKPATARQPPERTTAETMRATLAANGIWPLIWSSGTRGMPPVDGSEQPRRILVNCVTAEPFRARGKVVLQSNWRQVAAGLRFLPRLLAEYGMIHLVLTELSDPVVQTIRKETEGHAWLKIETAPVRYPAEHPRVLCRALRNSDRRIKPDEIVWVLDVQAVQALGACMGEGLPLHERIVAVGGPGACAPCHVRVRVGTPLNQLLDPTDLGESKRVLRGGLFRGSPVNPNASVGYTDDAFFVLPRPAGREFLGFTNPGFDRVSILPCFASRLTGAADRHLTTSLRGERRPCISCGLCEEVCPMQLLPQVLHRYLHRDAIDEAEQTGLPLCIGCGLCAYICPSKIELRHQFLEAQRRLQIEHAQTVAAEAAQERLETSRQHEKEHSEDWRK